MGLDAQYRQLVAAALVALAGPAAAECRLALSLGLDVSSSVDGAEYRLQTDGLASALVDPAVVDAFLAWPEAPVALQIYEWSSARRQAEVIDWRMIRGAEDLQAVAGVLAGRERAFTRYATAVGEAILYGARRLEEAPACGRHTLDLSGDGQSNDGLPPREARSRPEVAGITINGLVIGVTWRYLAEYYRAEVIQGPGAFVEVAERHADFAEAMKRKLIREVTVQVSAAEAAEAQQVR